MRSSEALPAFVEKKVEQTRHSIAQFWGSETVFGS